MPIVNYDEKILVSSVLQSVSDSYDAIASAVSVANGINFPGNDFGWGTIKEKIDSCRADTRSYHTWLSTKLETMEGTIAKNEDSLHSLQLEPIKPRKTIVK